MPRNPQLAMAWRSILTGKISVSRVSELCQRHFHANDIIRTKSGAKLKPNALPELFIENDTQKMPE